MESMCRCCIKGLDTKLPRKCPDCDHIFQGNGWDGIDAHWKARHEAVMPYRDFWRSLCVEHGGQVK